MRSLPHEGHALRYEPVQEFGGTPVQGQLATVVIGGLVTGAAPTLFELPTVYSRRCGQAGWEEAPTPPEPDGESEAAYARGH